MSNPRSPTAVDGEGRGHRDEELVIGHQRIWARIRGRYPAESPEKSKRPISNSLHWEKS